MTDAEKLKGIAIAFLTESQSDYKAVRILIENSQYNLAIYHAQQCVEKLLKACLAAEGHIGIYKHEIFYFFKDATGNKFDASEMDILTDNIPELEEEWSVTRYPGWDNSEIWIPSEQYTIEDATEIGEKMEIVSNILKKFLKEKHNIAISKP